MQKPYFLKIRFFLFLYTISISIFYRQRLVIINQNELIATKPFCSKSFVTTGSRFAAHPPPPPAPLIAAEISIPWPVA